MKARAALLALLLGGLCASASALAVRPGKTEELRDEVKGLKDAVVGNAADADVYALAQNIFGRVPGTQIVVNTNLRGWDRERGIEQAPATVERLLSTADKRLGYYNKVVPKPVEEAMAYARGMKRDGQVEFDPAGELKDEQMGAYMYLARTLQLGRVALNRSLRFLASKIGDAIAFSTLIHETGHARDHMAGKLNPKDVIDGEVLAFKTQYLWLKIADPFGEKVCFLRAAMMHEQRERPNQLSALALTYLDSMAKLQATNGDERAIRRMAEELGYRDGQNLRDGPGVTP